MKASELSRDHHGWLVEIPSSPDSTANKCVIVLGGVRSWTHEGQDRVGVLDVGHSDPNWRGVEYVLCVTDEVHLDRQLREGVPRIRKTDYPNEATS